MKSLLALVSLITLAIGSARAFTTTDLSLFAGRYHGSVSLGPTYTGPATLTFKVSPTGKAATLSIAGNVTIFGTTYDVGNRFRFSRGHSVHIAKVEPPILEMPVSGVYSYFSQSLTASATYTTSKITIWCTVLKSGHKATLNVEETVKSSGSSDLYQITYSGTCHVK